MTGGVPRTTEERELWSQMMMTDTPDAGKPLAALSQPYPPEQEVAPVPRTCHFQVWAPLQPANLSKLCQLPAGHTGDHDPAPVPRTNTDPTDDEIERLTRCLRHGTPYYYDSEKAADLIVSLRAQLAAVTTEATKAKAEALTEAADDIESRADARREAYPQQYLAGVAIGGRLRARAAALMEGTKSVEHVNASHHQDSDDPRWCAVDSLAWPCPTALMEGTT